MLMEYADFSNKTDEKDKKLPIIMNTDMNTLFNCFNMKIYESGYAECNSDWNVMELGCSTKIHGHLYYVVEGSGKLYYSDKTIAMLPGNLYYIPPYSNYMRSCEYMKQIFFHINVFLENNQDKEDFFRNCRSIISIPSENIDCIREVYFKNKISDFFQLYSLLMNDFSNIIMKYGFEISNNLSYNDLTNRVILYIKENLSASLRVGDIAKELYISKNKLGATFYKDMGIQLNRYIHTQLMNEIKTLLLDTDMTTTEISDKLEFCDRSYFSSFFKKNFGCSPKNFRYAYRKNIKKHEKKEP